MKSNYIKFFAGALVASTLLGSCNSDFLDEQQRVTYAPDYFKTEGGILGGITGMYAHLRYIYGQAYYYNSCLTGTDEATWGQSADGNFKDADLSGVGNLTPSTSRTDALWGTAFSNINAANGIIENAPAVGISEAITSEARFFRAFDYFLLVQTFGGVPLDLGSGELKFNVSQSTASVRNTVPEVYTKVVFPDLIKAVENLPTAGRVTGGVTKTTARLFLAKSYLTYAWWLENPNNIPTYPETPRTDPDGHTAQWYYQQAYDVAVAAIDAPGSAGLQPTFYDVNVGTNDRNNEILLMADHTQSSEIYNGGSLSNGSGGAPDNFAGWMMTWNYTSLQSAKAPNWTDKVNSVQREAAQPYGRPWVRMAPPQGVFINTFADKTNDSRYDGTFTTVYRGNWDKTTLISTNPVLYGANALEVRPGSAIFSFLNEEPSAPIDYSNTTFNSGVGVGVLPGRADFVLPPSRISRRVYPGLWKLGPYRTDNAGGLGQPNAGSTRPFNVAKFSELYLVAAEAAVKGASTQSGKSARELVNVLRARAGKWRWSNAQNAQFIQDNSAAITAATPAAIDINYILAERSREYFGEGYRWFDLVRTQKWNELAGTYVICGPNLTDTTPQTFTRTIQPFHYLRPIPISQINFMNMPAAQLAAYQNPGYVN